MAPAEALAGILTKHATKPVTSISGDLDLAADLGIDELSKVELVMDLETLLNIDLPESASRSLTNVKDVMQMVDQYR